jgi:hypothetical protein
VNRLLLLQLPQLSVEPPANDPFLAFDAKAEYCRCPAVAPHSGHSRT